MIAPTIEDGESFAETVRATYEDNDDVAEFTCHVTAGEGRAERHLHHRSRPIESGLYEGGRVELYYDVTERVERERVSVEHAAGDHPALASAYRGQAAHLLSADESLRDAGASAALGSRLNVSVKTPEGFVALFDAESLYEAVEGGEYPGPDRDPRA